jgi:hypothetical protein
MGAGHNGRGGGFKADGSGRQEPKTGGVDVQSESRMGMGMGMRCDPTTASGIHPQGAARLAGGCSAETSVCVERVRAGTGGPLVAVANDRGGARGTCRDGQALMFQNGETREDMALQRPWPRRSVAPGWRGSAQRFTSCPSRLGSGARGWPRPLFTRTWLCRRLAGRRGSGLRGLCGLSQLCTLPFSRTDQRPV